LVDFGIRFEPERAARNFRGVLRGRTTNVAPIPVMDDLTSRGLLLGLLLARSAPLYCIAI
jgi:hypothetical protein